MEAALLHSEAQQQWKGEVEGRITGQSGLARKYMSFPSFGGGTEIGCRVLTHKLSR